MEQKGELVSYRPDIKVVDCTLRDGGLVNNFEFSDEFVRELYKANVAAGVDYMEFGYKASKDLFDPKKFGKWKFCNEEDIRDIVGENNTDLKISVMADVGRTDYKKDIIPKSESVIDMVRVATYINTIPSIATASETSPIVAVSAAVPLPVIVTTPSLSTLNTFSLLLLHTSALAVLAGLTSAVA